jgi:hypothetical protein
LTIYLKLALRIREILQSKGQGVRQRARFDETDCARGVLVECRVNSDLALASTGVSVRIKLQRK